VAVSVAGCSKTEDIAPERKVFGEPPRIESFEIEFKPEATVSCDVTEILLGQLCVLGVPGAQATAPIEVSGPYSSALMRARVVDPESTPERTNLLLVAASYRVPDSMEENTFVLLDDATVFQRPQQDERLGGKDCGESEGVCVCQPKIYDVDVNDEVAGDQTFTRGLAIVESGTPAILLDCILDQLRRDPVFGIPPGATLSFRLDAIDRQGNLDTFPEERTITVGDFTGQEIRLTCTGDECGCCIYTHPGDYPQVCIGKPGLIGPPGSGFENGICVDLF
jgi:hypothetical protein